MNRPYRGKRVTGGEWVYGSLMVDYRKLTFINMSQEIISGLLSNVVCELVEVIPETVGQATGKEDKNGTMIYGSIEVDGKMLVTILASPIFSQSLRSFPASTIMSEPLCFAEDFSCLVSFIIEVLFVLILRCICFVVCIVYNSLTKGVIVL